jgi:uncharacterized protein YjcR
MTTQPLLLLDTEAIAWHYEVAVSTIRSWARRDHWQPYGTRRHRRWNLREAQASYEQRH